MPVIRNHLILGHRVSDLFHALETDSYIILTGDKPKIFEGSGDQSSEEVWCQLYWALFFRNQVYPGLAKSLTIDHESKTILVASSTNSKEVFKFETCLISCPEVVEFLVPDLLEMKTDDNIVVDYYEAASHSKHELSSIEVEDSFIKSIKFFVTPRIDGNKEKKDFVAISRLSEDQLRMFEYSDTMVSFAVKDIIATRLCTPAPRIRHVFREVTPNRSFKICRSIVKTCKKLESTQILTDRQYEQCKRKYFK